MNITLTGIKIVQDNKFLAFEKNSGVDVINITVDTDDEWTYKLDVKYPDKCCSGEALYNIINLTRTGNVCTAILTSDMLPFAGKYTMQLRGINGDKVAHSDTFDAWVKYSIEPGSTYDPVPSEFYQIEENITEMNNNPPYPSDDGYWMIWDVNTRVYKKSDIKIINGLPEISESTKDMALYNDGEKAEWREQRNPIPDWQENDPESPNYIRNRNGGYYTWDEENPIGKILSDHQSVLHFSDGAPDGQTPCYIVVMRGTNKTEFFKHFEYLFGSGNADELGFRLTNWASVYNGYYIAYAPSGADITDIEVYAATPVAFPLELTELQLATQITAGLVKVGVVSEGAAELFGHEPITMHLPEGKIEASKPWVQVPSFEYSESGGMVPQNVAPAYVQNGFVVESSNYLAGILGIFSTDFPIQIVGASMVYGSGYYPCCPCQFFTKTGKSGHFDWRVTGKAENAVLNPYIMDKYAVSDTRMSTSPVGYASRDEKYATVQTPFTVWDSYDGTFRFSLSPGYGLIINQSDFFKTGLGLTDTDFPITLTCMNSEYPGSYTQYPTLSFFLSTATGVTGTFALKQLNDSSACENVNLHRSASGDSDLLIVRITPDGGTWSADKTYAEMKQALDDGKVVQGVIDDSTSIGYVNGDYIVFQLSLFYSENEQNRYFMYDAIEFIVSEDGIMALPNDDLMGSYRCVILPAQTLLVTNNNGALSAEMIGPVEPLENPLTYLVHAFFSMSEYTIPTLTALYGTNPYSPIAERFYFSNAVITPNSDNTSAKIDFIFKSADATKTLTGSVTTVPNDWDKETPLDETWTYEEKDLLDGAVRYDEAQSLTDAQKSQARDNIGALPVDAGVGQAEVGQILSVKSVDATGKPNSWNVVAKPKDGEKGDTGPSNVLTIGTVESGAQASATITGEPPNQTLNLVLPKGDAGATPNIQIGTVTTLDAGADATASMSGTPENPLLNLGIPKGADGGSDRSLGLTGATVGQIAKITAVDESGKPTAWNPVDMPGGGGVWTLVHEQVLTEPAESYTYALDNVRAAALVLFPNAAIDGGWKRVKINNLDVPLTNGKVEAQNGIAFAIDLDAPFKIFGTAQATGRLLATYGIVGSVITSLTADDITEINSIGVATSTLLIAGAKISIYVRE